ncbi:unnamed protein product [Lactuca virosa]|uniref:Uncharacterized protein n=1 Tax=Lactuca virosa TaxID=75947 RepID=A0AAU9NIE5_9ASTR|nr:unnamed protein product [Lactuca virosa]
MVLIIVFLTLTTTPSFLLSSHRLPMSSPRSCSSSTSQVRLQIWIHNQSTIESSDEFNQIQAVGGRFIHWEGATPLEVLAMSRSSHISASSPAIDSIWKKWW